MTKKTQAERTSAKALSRFAAVAAVLLTLCLVFMMPVGAEEITENWGDYKQFGVGHVTVDGNTFQVYSPEGLAWVASDINSSNNQTNTIKLMNDINLNGKQ